MDGLDDGDDGSRVAGGHGCGGPGGSGAADRAQDVESVTGVRGDHPGEGDGPGTEGRGEVHAACGVPEQGFAGSQFVREERDTHEARTPQRGAQRFEEPWPPVREEQGAQLLARQSRLREPRQPGEVAGEGR